MKDERKTKKQLIQELAELRQRVAAADAPDPATAEKALEERVKELTCLYAVTLDMQQDLLLGELCQRVIGHLIPAMQFPEIAVPVIDLDGKRFAPEDATEGLSHGLQAPISSAGRVHGQLRVYYLEERPFLVPEEQNLINGVARALGAWLEHRQAEEALRESEEMYRILFETMGRGVVYQGADGQIASANPAAERILGLSLDQMQGRTSMDPRWRAIREDETDFPGDEHPSMVALRTGKEVRDAVMGVVNPLDETYRWININAVPLFRSGESQPYQVYTTFEDITARRQLEAQLQEYAQNLEHMVGEKVRELEQERAKVLHTSKLASLGEMATGIAHELNQPLTSILFEAGYLQDLSQPSRHPDLSVLDSERLRQIGEAIASDVTRCTRIIDHLRAFARAPERELEYTDLNQAVEGSLILTGQRLRENDVVLQLELEPGLPPILGEGHQLEQVFLNLINNAAYAAEQMERRAKEAGRADFQKMIQIVTRINADGEVEAVVRDNGCGIPAAEQEHIFEPFFTTKPVGEGTGLGLSISYGIVTSFGGQVSFQSQDGQGTEFVMRFPVAGRG